MCMHMCMYVRMGVRVCVCVQRPRSYITASHVGRVITSIFRIP